MAAQGYVCGASRIAARGWIGGWFHHHGAESDDGLAGDRFRRRSHRLCRVGERGFGACPIPSRSRSSAAASRGVAGPVPSYTGHTCRGWCPWPGIPHIGGGWSRLRLSDDAELSELAVLLAGPPGQFLELKRDLPGTSAVAAPLVTGAVLGGLTEGENRAAYSNAGPLVESGEEGKLLRCEVAHDAEWARMRAASVRSARPSTRSNALHPS
jgi:hypothetical protein